MKAKERKKKKANKNKNDALNKGNRDGQGGEKPLRGGLSECTQHGPVLLSERLSAVSPHCLTSWPTGETAWYGSYVSVSVHSICIVRAVQGGWGYVTQTDTSTFLARRRRSAAGED